MGRLHIHLGRMIKDREGERAEGIRGNTKVGVVFGGSECRQRGSIFYRSANNVILTEGINGVFPANLALEVFSIRDGRALYTRTDGWIKPPIEGTVCGESVETQKRSEERFKEPPGGEVLGEAAFPPYWGTSQSSARWGSPAEGSRSFSCSYRSSDSSTPYVIQTPESRKRMLANDDPFGGSSRVKIELSEGECDGEPRFAEPQSIGVRRELEKMQ